MPSYRDFVLPGIQSNPASNLHLICQVCLAYSSTANRRKLEGHFYALWSEILNLLVHDLKGGVIVCPQYKVYRASYEDPDSSTVTQADRLAVEKIPDFGLIGAVLADRRTKDLLKQPTELPFIQWSNIHIAAWAPYAVVELKRPAGRHFEFHRDFQVDIMARMQSAVTAAEEQARIVFWESGETGPAYQAQTLILIAVTGEWWKFRVAKASEFCLSEEGQIIRDSFPLDDDVLEDQDAPVDEPANPPRILKRPKKPLAAKSMTMKRWTTLDPAYMEEDCDEVSKAMPPEGRWSKFILYGTPASNQRMFLLHRTVQELMTGLRPRAEANVARWREDGYYSEESDISDEDDKGIVTYGEE